MGDRQRRIGFPRPRGDGPVYRPPTEGGRWVSPPTRGWTPLVRSCGLDAGGFPAHAGMDQHRGHHDRRVRRFPRPRGDGPQACNIRIETVPVSPPTRGWTHPQRRLGQEHLGFPAHAGMDPAVAEAVNRSGGFPRPRGDGPDVARALERAVVVSPPTRGWTRLREDPLGPRGGFPAHAGMDRRASAASSAAARFPRPRGDGPDSRVLMLDQYMVSPPTRGWTHILEALNTPLGGFPAHAGMDPCCP